MMKKRYFIRYGLGGGFGGANDFVLEDYLNSKEASNRACELAEEIYDSYDGMYGLRSVEDIMEEDEVKEEDAKITWEEERDSWLDYSVELYDPEKHDSIIEMLS